MAPESPDYAFSIRSKILKEAESELGVIFPTLYKAKMIEDNGGEAETEDEGRTLVPFFDKSDNQRISRTCNHIVVETTHAREWDNFPQEAIAIGENGCGCRKQPMILSDTATIKATFYYHLCDVDVDKTGCSSSKSGISNTYKNKKMKSKKVDEFLAKLDHPLKKELAVLRDTIMKVHPEITEDVKWGGPSFYYKGDIATFSPRVKDTITLVFHQAEGLPAGAVLEPASKGKAYAKFKSMTEVEAKSKDLRVVIQEWIKFKDKS